MDAITLALLKALGGGSGLPPTGSASAGDVLSLDDNKKPQWSAPSSGGGVLVATVVYDNETVKTDKTWQEIHDAPLAVIKDPDKYFSTGKTLLFAGYVSGSGRVGYSMVANALTGESYDFWSETADGYPALVDDGGE